MGNKCREVCVTFGSAVIICGSNMDLIIPVDNRISVAIKNNVDLIVAIKSNVDLTLQSRVELSCEKIETGWIFEYYLVNKQAR